MLILQILVKFISYIDKIYILCNQPCQARPTIVDINSNETFFYPFTVSVYKPGDSCNTTDDPYV